MKESLDQAEIGSQTALSFLRGVMQRPRHGSHDIHGDGPGVVADKGDLAVALVGRAVNSMRPGLASKAAQHPTVAADGRKPGVREVIIETYASQVLTCGKGIVIQSP